MHHPVVLAASDFLVPNGTFIAEVVAFLVILEVLRRFVLPPLNKAMTERQELIRKQIEDGAAAKERLEAAERDYRAAMEEQKREASRIREEAAQEKAQIIAEARVAALQQAQEIHNRATEQLAAERAQVLRSLRGEVGELALALAEKITRSSLEDDARAQSLVIRFVSELGEVSDARS
ncbi:MAG: F0F1 ATP synthase subunit B [Mycobacteriales bacterium]